MIEARITQLDIDEIMSYLGAGGKRIPVEEIERVRNCAEELPGVCEPKLVYRRVPVADGPDGRCIEGLKLDGNDIWNLLKGCREAVIFGATIGQAADMLIARLQVTDMAKAVIMDACASTAVENICNNFESDVRSQVEMEGRYLTDRYSPGYGDLPIAAQKGFGEFLNCQRRIGVIVADNFMMTPVKSVTAIMGISDVPVSLRGDKCSTCSNRDKCSIRLAKENNGSISCGR